MCSSIDNYRPNLIHICVWAQFCVRKSQAITTKLGMEAQNLKCEVEFVCGTNRILTSGFMPPSWILAYYSKIIVTRTLRVDVLAW
jgi:hypothetical protein